MPELPEVETLRRDLLKTLVGKTIEHVELRLPKIFTGVDGLGIHHLEGHQVLDITRRAKFLTVKLSGGLALVIHLKLTGQLVQVDARGAELVHGGHPVPRWGAPLPHRATHVTFHLSDGSLLYLTDIRQFGRLWLMPEGQVAPFLAKAKLGPEPLTKAFSASDLGMRLKRRSIPIKSALLNQSVVGGIGNIYADESLWRAAIHPLAPANTLDQTQVRRLHRSIRAVLDYALVEGVAFVPQGKAISDREFPYCHGRAGTPCRRCGREILKQWVGGRGTYWCPGCQLAVNGRA